MYTANAIANYFVQLAQNAQQTLTPMKLVKLVYFAHAWHLALEETSLIDEPILAWQYGPVIDSVYTAFKQFGNEQITSLAMDQDKEHYQIAKDDSFMHAFLQKIWDEYGNYSGIQLANLTHEKGSPWHRAWHDARGKTLHNAIISNDLIKQHYQHFLHRS